MPCHHCSDEEHEHALPDATSAKIAGPSQYRAPSWSWAAIDGEIEFENLNLTPQINETGRGERIAHLVKVSVTPLGDYNFGRVNTGFVKLQVSRHRLLRRIEIKHFRLLLANFASQMFPYPNKLARFSTHST